MTGYEILPCALCAKKDNEIAELKNLLTSAHSMLLESEVDSSENDYIETDLCSAIRVALTSKDY